MEKEKSILPLLVIGGLLLLGAKKAEAKVPEKVLPPEERLAIKAFEKEREIWGIRAVQPLVQVPQVPEWVQQAVEKVREIMKVIEVPPSPKEVEKGIERAEEKVKKVLPPEERIAIGAFEHERKLREIIEEIRKRIGLPPVMPMPMPAPPAVSPLPELVKGLEAEEKVKKVLSPEERVAIGAFEERKLREVIEEVAKKLPKPPVIPQPAPPAPELVKGLENVIKVVYL